ncbi:protein of unknown function [Microbacterium sp. Nx66]|nr:protein of unknown function [Microbacterium sp. Nx66]
MEQSLRGTRGHMSHSPAGEDLPIDRPAVKARDDLRPRF